MRQLEDLFSVFALIESNRLLGRFQMEEWRDEDHRAAVGYLLGKQ